MIIDAHAHLVPAPLLEQIRKEIARFPSVQVIEKEESAVWPSNVAQIARGVSRYDVRSRFKCRRSQQAQFR